MRGPCIAALTLLPLCSAFLAPPPTHVSRHALAQAARVYASQGISDIPSNAAGVAAQAVESVRSALEANERRIKVEIILPGLNPRLESSAPFSAALMLSLLREILAVFDDFPRVKVLFSSAGDAAMATKAYSDASWPLTPNLRFAGLTPNSANSEDDAIVFVTPRNSVGDPVVLIVEECVAAAPEAITVLFNPDLGEKVALGIRERDRRNAFLNTFVQAYYFRNLFFLRRPDLVPVEKGALLQRYGLGWAVIVTNTPMPGPGSLNRFMKLAVYRRHPNDPSEYNPPEFFPALTSAEEPTRDQISDAVENAGVYAAAAAAAAAVAAAVVVESAEEARAALKNAADGASTHPDRVVNAMRFLEQQRQAAATSASGDIAEKEPAASLTTDLELIFTAAERPKGQAMGSKLETPGLKIVLSFSRDGKASAAAYMGPWAVKRAEGACRWLNGSATLSFDPLNLFQSSGNATSFVMSLIDVTSEYVASRGPGGQFVLLKPIASK